MTDTVPHEGPPASLAAPAWRRPVADRAGHPTRPAVPGRLPRFVGKA